MVKSLFFELIRDKGNSANHFGIDIDKSDVIYCIFSKYTLINNNEPSFNLLFNELRKDKDLLKDYEFIKYDFINKDFLENYEYIKYDFIDKDNFKLINRIDNKTYNYEDIKDIIDNSYSNFSKLLNLKYIKTDHIDLDTDKSIKLYDGIYYTTNEKIINSILNLEHDIKYNIIKPYYFNMYYIDIPDEYKDYIKISYDKPYYKFNLLEDNKYAIFNKQVNQYLVIGITNDEKILNYYNNKDVDEYNIYSLILYFDYDKYFTSNIKKYIKKYKELFSFEDKEIFLKSLNVINNDNNIKEYVKFEKFYDTFDDKTLSNNEDLSDDEDF